MDCYFRQYWRDSRLSFMGPINNLSLSIKMLEKIWRPDTYILNGKQSYVHTITVPNKLLRINQDGDILYSMRLTIKANCPMSLRNFPMDRQSCPLILGSYAYPIEKLVYHWTPGKSITFVPGMTISQFDFISSPKRNFTFKKREGEFSLLQVNFNLKRHTGYFVIQIYVPCVLIVVLSWVSFWIHREATSDRIGLGITSVLTLSTISLDSRTDLPKVRYATALDWFLLMSFFYCIATILEFAAVHYFTKTGSGEIPFLVSSDEIRVHPKPKSYLSEDDDDDDVQSRFKVDYSVCSVLEDLPGRRISNFMPEDESQSRTSTMERHTQTEHKIPIWKLVTYCLVANEKYRKKREQEVSREGYQFHINSVSRIDRVSRILFPASFGFLNLLYWITYVTYQETFVWKDPAAVSH
uniref:Gamma-aminobutyric acid receptor subunit alpha-6 n=3 Tax=Cacopsylla melanoneura TaxID=428564 RepID=A0A8D8QVM0_9HEMI